MLTRRRVLTALMLALAPWPCRRPWAGSAAVPRAGFHIVNGWVLTDRDLADLANLAR